MLKTLLSLAALAVAASVPHAVRAETSSEALFDRARKATAGARTLTADVVMEFEFPGQPKGVATGTVKLMKPNFGALHLKGLPGGGEQKFLADGKNLYMVNLDAREYIRQPLSPAALFPLPSSPVGAFFDLDPALRGAEPGAVEDRTVDGVRYRVVQMTATASPRNRALYFGPSGLLERADLSDTQNGLEVRMSFQFRNVKVNEPLTEQQFVFEPPAGFKLFEPTDPSSGLLPLGREAPDFQVERFGGGQISLSELRKGKKAVLVNFWFHG
jgi:outer membrane lipoprotein-sorting protein